MSLKHKDLDIPNDDPFANCKLDRKKYAEVLTDIVGSYSDGFVLAINNQWGAGKTTFVKMWQKHLEQEVRSFKTIYFNAWENDFDNNPFIAITSEINNLISEPEQKFVEGFLNKAAKISKSALPTLLEHGAKKYLGESFIENLTKETTEGVLNLFSDELKKYSNRKNGINEFKKVLEEYVQASTTNKPLILIIDELDRCRPNYAVEVLENIKHLFSVKGIVFVLSIDKVQLGHAVRGVYGSELIDADEYLKRFIDIEYNIPKPDTKNYVRYLFEYYSFGEFFSLASRMKIAELTEDSNRFLLMAECLLSNSTLRQQEKVFIHSKLVIDAFKENEYTFSHLLFFLVYLKVMDNEKYQKIDRKEYTLQELSDVFGDIINSKNYDSKGFNFTYVESLLIWFYNNDLANNKQTVLIQTIKSSNVKPSSPISSKIAKNYSELVVFFTSINRSSYGHFKIGLLIDKINLTQTVIS